MGARTASVLFLAPEPVGPESAGPVHRSLKLAEVVAEHCQVTLAAPSPSTFPDGPFRTLETGPVHDQRLARVLSEHDIAVVQTLPSPRQLLAALSHAPRLVVDLIAPLPLEAAELKSPARDAIARWRTRELVAHLAAADLVLCTTEKQRDLMLGVALVTRVLEGEAGPLSAQDRIAVVPYGVDDHPPRQTRAALRATDLVSDGDWLAIWAGGMWSWLDPLTAIKAVERLRPTRPDLKLVFAAFEHPLARQREAHESLVAEAIGYTRDRSLDGMVIFRPRWLEKQDYYNHLLEADVGLSLHRPTLEAHFAWRARVLDYLWAGLPVICTGGDTMSELVASEGLGRVVEPLDVGGCVDAVQQLTAGRRHRVDSRAALERFRWRDVAQPLVEYCLDPDSRPPRPRRNARILAARGYPAFFGSLYGSGGKAELLRALGRRGFRVFRRGSLD